MNPFGIKTKVRRKGWGMFLYAVVGLVATQGVRMFAVAAPEGRLRYAGTGGGFG